MSLSSRTRIIRRLLGEKAYRDAYVLEHIKNGVAFQIRTNREDRNWTQGKLGEVAGKPRNVISRLEDPNYGKLTLATLLEIASAFDVGLLVKFVPFSRLVKEYDDVSPEALSALSVADKKEIVALNAWAIEDAAMLQSEDTTQGAKLLQFPAQQATPQSVAPQIEYTQTSLPGILYPKLKEASRPARKTQQEVNAESAIYSVTERRPFVRQIAYAR